MSSLKFGRYGFFGSFGFGAHESCQRSYLSRVISENLQLTPDHAFKLARFWGLPLAEREYFQTLVDFERAGDSEYRAYLKERLQEMKRRNESIQERTARSALSSRLGLKREILAGYLEQLRAQGLVEHKGGRWLYKGGEFHAPKNSPLVVLHHQNWRARAVLDAQDPGNDNIHYTAVQTVSRSDFERLKEMLLRLISETSRISGPSSPEEGYALTCDLFKI
jgi:plasmid maintenance system antidote protein VapI